MPAVTFKPTGRWFRGWEAEYGLTMRMANRKFACARSILKERLEIDWLNIYSLRYYILLVHGYDPMMQNSDQSPFHNNETGSQNKPILAVKGSKVPVTEGNADVKTRWTANLTTCSDRKLIEKGYIPPGECMYKAAIDGTLNDRLQEFRRSRGFPEWMTATTSPKGSYREQDVVTFIQRHFTIPTAVAEDTRWSLYLLDDMAAHRSPNVSRLCWTNHQVCVVHPGCVTPYLQTCDTHLNEFVRKDYGDIETRILIDKLRAGESVPRITPEESLTIMLQVIDNPKLHLHAADGFKQIGLSVDLFGAEDALICREAG
jgi:hypothetical protein